jgi:hypothetical protein
MFSTVILPECGRFLPGDGRFTEAFALATDPGYGHPATRSRAIGNMLGWMCLFRRDRSALSGDATTIVC